MLTLHPQYITDTAGNKSLVILPANEFDKKNTLFDLIDTYIRDAKARKAYAH